jgi:hypothetical protein
MAVMWPLTIMGRYNKKSRVWTTPLISTVEYFFLGSGGTHHTPARSCRKCDQTSIVPSTVLPISSRIAEGLVVQRRKGRDGEEEISLILAEVFLVLYSNRLTLVRP